MMRNSASVSLFIVICAAVICFHGNVSGNSSSHTHFMKRLIKQGLLYRATHGRFGLSAYAVREAMRQRMQRLNRKEMRNKMVCSGRIRSLCIKISAKCHTSILVKRSIEGNEMDLNKDRYASKHIRHISKRNTRSRRSPIRIHINCNSCRSACWS